MLNCVLEYARATECKHCDGGNYCKLDHITAKIANGVGVCARFEPKIKRCSICSIELREPCGHDECVGCYHLIYDSTDVSRYGSVHKREALKDLVARVRKDEHSKCPSEEVLKLREEVLKLRRQDMGTHA